MLTPAMTANLPCAGPLGKRVPEGTCRRRTSSSFMFPTGQDVAMLATCSRHHQDVGEWISLYFGGTWYSDVEGIAGMQAQLAEEGRGLVFPTAEELLTLPATPDRPPALGADKPWPPPRPAEQEFKRRGAG